MQERILRPEHVMELTGLSRSSLYRMESAGDFPKRRRLGPRAVGWLESEVKAWAEKLPTANLVFKKKKK